MAFEYLLKAFIDEVDHDGMLNVSEDVQGGAFYFPMFPLSDEARKKFPKIQHPIDHVNEAMGLGLHKCIAVSFAIASRCRLMRSAIASACLTASPGPMRKMPAI